MTSPTPESTDTPGTGPQVHAVTVLGLDRPGIIAETTALLADLGLNLEDSSMTLLRGHFAMTLVCAGPATGTDVEAALTPLAADGSLDVSVRPVPARTPSHDGGDGGDGGDAGDAGDAGDGGSGWVLTVHGGDRPGIVSAVVGEVAAVGGSITDLTTRLAGHLYLLVAEISLPDDVDVTALDRAVGAAASGLGVGATLRPAETDDL